MTDSLILPSEDVETNDTGEDASRGIRHTVWVGVSLITLTFGAFGGWAASAPLDSAVVARGQLTVESRRKTVQHLEGGIVKEILVHDGDVVTPGQVLLRLDDTKAAASLEMVQNQYDAALAQLSRLEAERDGKASVDFPPELTGRLDGRVRALLAAQTDQFTERHRSLETQVAVLAEREGQLNSEIDGYRIQEDARRRQIELSRHQLAGLRELAAKGWYPKNRLLDLQRDIARLEGEMGADAASEARTRKSISETEMQSLQLRQQFREQVAKDLDAAQNRANDLHDQLATAQDTVRRLDVVAPVGGKVQNLRLATDGGVITPASELMDIVPLDDRLVIEAQVNPADIEAVADEAHAEVRFSALRGRTTPVLRGTVTTVSADHLTDQRTGAPYYATRVEISDKELARLGGRHLSAGMPVEVMIKGGERTALDYMLKPLADSFSTAMRER